MVGTAGCDGGIGTSVGVAAGGGGGRGVGAPGIPKPKALQEIVETAVAVTGTDVTVYTMVVVASTVNA